MLGEGQLSGLKNMRYMQPQKPAGHRSQRVTHRRYMEEVELYLQGVSKVPLKDF